MILSTHPAQIITWDHLLATPSVRAPLIAMREAAGWYHLPFRYSQSFVNPWQTPTWMTFWPCRCEQPRLCHNRKFLPLWSARRKVFPVSPNCRHTFGAEQGAASGTLYSYSRHGLRGTEKPAHPNSTNQPPLSFVAGWNKFQYWLICSNSPLHKTIGACHDF